MFRNRRFLHRFFCLFCCCYNYTYRQNINREVGTPDLMWPYLILSPNSSKTALTSSLQTNCDTGHSPVLLTQLLQCWIKQSRWRKLEHEWDPWLTVIEWGYKQEITGFNPASLPIPVCALKSVSVSAKSIALWTSSGLVLQWPSQMSWMPDQKQRVLLFSGTCVLRDLFLDEYEDTAV